VTRLLSGVVLLLLVGAVGVFAPPAGVLAVALLFAAIGATEYAALSGALGAPVSSPVLAVATVAACAATALPALGGLSGPAAGDLALPVVLAILLAYGVGAVRRGQVGADSLARVASPVFGALYVGAPLGAIVAIRAIAGRDPMLLLVIGVIISDTAQYYSGRLFGRRPLAPVLSPKKTIEGAIGGLVVGAIGFAAIAQWWWPPTPLPVRMATGAVIVVLGICGDLSESMIKRAAGVKDSGALIPGHGGVLDRIDAQLFAAPVYYVIIRYLVLPS